MAKNNAPPSRATAVPTTTAAAAAAASLLLLALLATRQASAFQGDAPSRRHRHRPAAPPTGLGLRRQPSPLVGGAGDRPGLLLLTTAARNAASTSSSSSSSSSSSTVLYIESKKYGRGAEIWPPTNEEPVLLSDSFPGGSVPSTVLDVLDRQDAASLTNANDANDDDDDDEEESTTSATPPTSPPTASTEAPPPRRGRKRKLIRGAVSRILRGAAASQVSVATGDRSARGGDDAFWTAPVDRSPAVVAAMLVGLRLVRVTDVMAVVGLTTYLIVLGLVGSSPKERSEALNGIGSSSGVGGVGGGGGGSRVMLPSLPPRGHVPNLVSNPLGMALTNSVAYRTWLRLGAVVGLLLPLGAVGWYGWGGPTRDMVAAGAAARPVFLICCQAVSEAASRRLLAPLPLRILIPLAYSAIRLGPLWDWALCPTPLGHAGRVLAATNYLYWSVNLFGFLLPFGAIRYMRAHFYCVEAAEVTLREGGETAAGLLS